MKQPISKKLLKMNNTITEQSHPGNIIELGPFMKDLIAEIDIRVNSVTESQSELLNEMERLNAELDLFQTLTDIPPVQECIDSLVAARGQVITLNSRLTEIQARLDRISSRIPSNK